jgi:hypothetical protein
MMQSTTPHWPQPPQRHVGVGAVNQGLTDAAQAVVNFFAANACTRASVPEVASFQATYNVSGMPGHLTVDGQYGGNTERALQIVLNNSPAAGGGGPVQAVPPNCFGMAVPETPVVDVTPAAPVTPTTTTTTTTTTAPSTMSPWIIGGAAAVVAGGVGYAVYRARKRRRG